MLQTDFAPSFTRETKQQKAWQYMQTGIDVYLKTPSRLQRRVGVVAHPASVTQSGVHTVDALIETGVNVCCAFGPQHGMRGDKQDNMVETDDYADPRHGIPVYSLYGTTRRPADQMLEQVDAIIFDLQDVGCRVYTFITTLLYVLQACAERRLPLVVLDPPAGPSMACGLRPVRRVLSVVRRSRCDMASRQVSLRTGLYVTSNWTLTFRL